MLRPISRRSFLAGSVGAVVLAACGNDSEDERTEVSVPEDDGGPDEAVSLLIGSSPIVAGEAGGRVSFLVYQGDRDPVAPDTRVAVAFAPRDGELGSPVEAVRHDAGLDQAYYLVETPFPSPGVWAVAARLDDGRSAQAAIEVKDPATMASPTAGEPMVAVPTATTADARGVDPICTRDPACPWHDLSLDQALQQGRPLAVLFGTPALCRTATCGPVLDVLLEERSRFEDQVQFIHVEVFTDLSGSTVTEPLRTYAFESEPVLLLAGGDGTVRRRINGIFDQEEARRSLEALLA